MEKTKHTAAQITSLPKCDTCMYYGLLINGANRNTVCRRYPPSVSTIVVMTPNGPVPSTPTALPGVSPLDYCGEHRPIQQLDS